MAMNPRKLAAMERLAREGVGGERSAAQAALARLGMPASTGNLPARMGASSPRPRAAIGPAGGMTRASAPPLRGGRTAIGTANRGPLAIGPGSGGGALVRSTGGGGAMKPPSLGGKMPGADNIPGPKNPRFSRKTLLGMGLGLGVAAGVAMNRRGEGASSGRQSIYKY